MIKSRIPVLPKSKKNPGNNEVEIEEKEKKTDSKSSVMVNKVLCERKIQEKPIASKKVVCQQSISSQIPGKRPNIKVAPKVKHGTYVKVNSKILPPKAGCPNADQRSVLQSGNVYKGGNKKTKQKLKFSEEKSEESSQPKFCEKENLPEDLCEPSHNSQKKDEDEFETHKAFRQALLNGTDVSPSILKMTSGAKLSSSFRPSIYKSLVMSSDPYKAALKAIEDAKLENIRPSLVRKESIFSTPLKSPFLVGNPYKEALKNLELLRTKKNKSHKKVTFSFQVDNALHHSDRLQNEELREEKESESRLTDIIERDETSQNSSRENSRKFSAVTEEVKAFNVNSSSSLELSAKKTLDQNSNSFEVNYLNHCLKSYQCVNSQNICKEVKSEFVTDKSLTPCVKEHFGTSNYSSIILSNHSNKCSSVKDSKIRLDIDKHDPAIVRLLHKDNDTSDSLKHSLMYLQQNKNLSSNSNSNVEALEERLALQSFTCETENRIFTPCPVSYKPQSSVTNSGSPEFLAEKVNKIVAHDMPICTPLVFKSLAKASEAEDDALIPIRLKLDFNNVDLKSKNEEILMCMESPEKKNASSGLLLKDIPTARKVLDLLADEECSVILLNQKLPTACARYMKNPLAVILSEGDEKHFLPVGSSQQQQ